MGLGTPYSSELSEGGGVVEDLCEAIGVVERSANDTEVDRGSFFRVRVRVDISMPLCRGRVLSLEDGEEC